MTEQQVGRLGPEVPTTTQTLFFAFTLKHGRLMSRPRYEPALDLVQQLVLAIERASPSFAWVQVLFVRTEATRALERMRREMSRSKKKIESPGVTVTGSLVKRRELHGAYYSTLDDGMKRAQEMQALPLVVVSVRGMWTGSERHIGDLPFSMCGDGFDTLVPSSFLSSSSKKKKAAAARLADMVSRNMVDDLSPHMKNYTGGRVGVFASLFHRPPRAPPSFFLAQGELGSYVHFPSGDRLDAMGSVHDWGVHSASIPVGVEMASSSQEPVPEGQVSVVRVRPPALVKPLTEEEATRLAFVASSSRRGFEVVYDHGRTSFLLSAAPGDMERYRMALEAVYGRLDCEPVAPSPSVWPL